MSINEKITLHWKGHGMLHNDYVTGMCR